eukprot:CAMPEP_0170791508 /NCGR_PEP_ID=MMETSP0733-20121128/21192_1 /TAXON_ID=186038 /ORGANISM="Fragilariopsis kerguelensis, Strain L26-C5" /LENGTH=316 /DNA_ID=CAMNT_0011139463 /DNA_START=19 /DNA_END=969 /DNA_ORIENTATION=+
MKGRCMNVLLRCGGGGRQITTLSSFMTSTDSFINNFDTTPKTTLLSCSITVTNSSSDSEMRVFARTIKRWKHAGKMGHKVETLKEMAHRPERETAQERRKKKKERKVAKKSGNGKNESVLYEVNSRNDDGDDLFFDDEENDFKGDIGENEEKSIRGAEPTAEMFDDVSVQAYGASTPLNAVAQVVITSPTLAQITCFDPSLAKDVVKAIQLTLELNPQLEEGGGGNIKVPLPRISMEVREKLSRSVKKRAEACKQRLRGVRRKAMEVVKKGKDGKIPGVSKDDAFSSSKEIEAMSEAAVETLNSIVAEKMDSIMAV